MNDTEQSIQSEQPIEQPVVQTTQPEQPKQPKKPSILLIAVLVVIAIVVIRCLWLGIMIFNGFKDVGYSSADVNKTEAQVKKYVTNHLKDKYGFDAEIVSKRKDLLDFCYIYIDDCLSHATNTDIYKYCFTATDGDKNERHLFKVCYTNSYRTSKKGKVTEALLEENYHYFDEKKKAEAVFSEYTDTYITHISVDTNLKSDLAMAFTGELVYIVYLDKFDVDIVNTITEKVKGISETFKIVITDNKDFYDEGVKSKNNHFNKSYYWTSYKGTEADYSNIDSENEDYYYVYMRLQNSENSYLYKLPKIINE